MMQEQRDPRTAESRPIRPTEGMLTYLEGRARQATRLGHLSERSGYKAQAERADAEALALSMLKGSLPMDPETASTFVTSERERLSTHETTPDLKLQQDALERVLGEVDELLHDPSPDARARFDEVVADQLDYERAQKRAGEAKLVGGQTVGAVVQINGRHYAAGTSKKAA